MIVKIFNRAIVIVLLVVIAILTSVAQVPMNLKQCIEYGLKNHRTNFISQNDVRSTQAKIQEARAAYLPTINVNGSLDNNLKVQQSVIPGALFGSDKDVRVAFTKKYNTVATAQVDQTLFDQSLITSFKANQYSRQEAQLNKAASEEAIIYNISSAYYQVFVNRQQVKYLMEDMDNYKQQLTIAKLKVDKGVMLEVDMNKILVNYNNTLSQWHAAESNVKQAQNQLKNEMGLFLTDSLAIDTNVEFTETSALATFMSAGEFSVLDRTEYKLSMVNISLLAIDEKRIKATALPKLTAYARYGGNAFGDHLVDAFGLTSFSAIGIKLNIPVFDGLKRNGQAKQARYSLLNEIEQQKLDKENYRLEYENIRTQLVEAQSTMQNDRRTLELAQSVVETTDVQYQKGVTDITDWLETQRSLKEAQSNYLSSLFKFYLSLVDLEKSKGTLQTFYNAL